MVLSLQELIKKLQSKQEEIVTPKENAINGDEYEEWIRMKRFEDNK